MQAKFDSLTPSITIPSTASMTPKQHQERLKQALKKRAMTQKPRKSLPSKVEIAQDLQSLIGARCESSADKYMLLKKRDELMCKARVKNTDVSVMDIVQGTCPDMCPEKERYMRESQKNLNKYECDSNGVMIPELTVKDYSRSAADQEEPLPHELRPTNVLEMTMNYLLNNIASEMPSSSSEQARWYDFLWSRTRSIRKDITQQMLKDKRTVDLVEKCTRLHVFAAYRLAKLDFSEFNQKMNTENLSKSLQTLRHMYDDLALEGQFCTNEAEFRSYDVILNLSDSNVHSQVLAYRDEVRKSEYVKVAMELATAYQNTNYVQFFRLLKRRASYLQACISHRYFSPVRHSALRIICSAYPLYPLEKFVDILGFDTEGEAQSFLDSIGIEMDQADENYISSRGWKEAFARMGGIETLPIGICRWIQTKAGNISLAEILCNGPCIPVRLPVPINSFDEDGRYVRDPFNAYSTNVAEDQASTKIAPIQSRLNNTTPQNGFSRPKEAREPKAPTEIQPLKPTGFTMIPKKDEPRPFNNAFLKFGGGFTTTFSKTIFSDTQKFVMPKNTEEKLEETSKAQENGTLNEARTLSKAPPVFAKKLGHEPQKLMPPPTPEPQLMPPKTMDSSEIVEKLNTVEPEIEQRVPSPSPPKQNIRQLKAEASKFIEFETEHILHWISTRETEFLAYSVYEEMKRLNSGLDRFRDNMFNLWLRQFTHRWRDFVQKKKLLRSFILHPQERHTSCSYSNQRSPHITPPMKRRRITAEQMELRLFARQFKVLRTEWLEKRYFAKWRCFVEFRKKKRYMDSALDHYCFLRTSYR